MKRRVIFLILIISVLFVMVGCNENKKVINNEGIIQKDFEANLEGINNSNLGNGDIVNKGFERKNTLIVATPTLGGNFNPIVADDIYDSWISRMIFDGLIGIDENGSVDNSKIAKKWNISEDKLVYTFYLNEGILFHDGEELTSEDIEFTYYTLADPNCNFLNGSKIDDIVGVDEYRQGLLDTIDGIKVIDNYTISFTINSPNVKKIREFSFGIMPKHYYNYDTFEEFKNLISKPIGSGIMMFKNYEVDKFIELEAYKGYFNGSTKIDGVIVKVVPLEIQAISVASGEVDIANPEPNIINYEMMKNSKIVNVQEFIENAYRCIGFNLRLEKFSDKRVRQALAYGIRMNDYIETQWKGFAKSCYSPISPISWAAPDILKLNKYDYDIEKSKLLLAQAGWIINNEGKLMKNGKQFIINWTTYKEAEWSINLMNVAKNNWGELGIEVVPNIMEFDEVVEEVFNKQNFELFNISWLLSADPDPYELFYSENDKLGELNAIGFHNEKVDEMIKLGRFEYNQDRRIEIYQKYAEIVNEELPYIYVSIGTTIWGVNSRVSNLQLGPYCDWVSCLKDIELEY